MVEFGDLDLRAIDTARLLAVDAVEKVGNGHPGTAMSLAPVAYLLYQKIMRHDPADPEWLGRDRLILSAGHSSLTLYTQLYLAGYGLELEDLKQLRTWGSLTPGHPEYGHTDGVEITTGPLGQGLASAVGFAMATRRERGLLDPDAAPGSSPFDHFTYVIASDGDLEEGVTAEASSLAGTQRLGSLIVIWDDNRISIEGDTSIAFTEDVLARYAAYEWHTQSVDWLADGSYKEDLAALEAAIGRAQADPRPSFIRLRTVIGWPAPSKRGSHEVHGSKLGAAEVADLKALLGFDPDQSFAVDDEVIAHARAVRARAAVDRRVWDAAFADWRRSQPERAALLDRLLAHRLPGGWEAALPEFTEGAVATRTASGKVLSALAGVLPELWGGSADLASSNNTAMAGEPSFLPSGRSSSEFAGDEYGRTLHFGIREHAMGSILNGIVLHGLTRAYGGTFFAFSDYMRGAVRLAALMGVPSIFVWTHDSIGLGEDGPTHQPVEHLTAMRAIPGLDVIRPADANETSAAWKVILEDRNGPSGLVLSRQNLPVFPRGRDGFAEASEVARGGYILLESSTGEPEVIILATGSEVQLAVSARTQLEAEGVPTRVVSMPCVEWFDRQPKSYREAVLPPSVRARVSVEAGLAMPWARFVGDSGESVSLEHFGASADYQRLYREFGITVEAVVHAAHRSLGAAALR